METGKPLIAILMAVYEPNLSWFREQLESLNAQTYPNLRLYIREDCSPAVPFAEIRQCIRECVTKLPYSIAQNAENVGSNETFARLTEEAEGEYFAYCDQDDIWLPEKLEVSQETIEKTGALLVCSDLFIIDAAGNQVAESITKVRRRHRFYSGGGLAEGLLISNFVTGCTMLVRAEEARAALPFCPYMVHDHYIALCCAAKGEIQSIKEPLIRYRLHGNNQTGILAGVQDKSSYRRERIELQVRKFQWLRAHFPQKGAFIKEIEQRLEWAQAREKNWKKQGGRAVVWKYRKFSPLTSLFELAAVWFPEWLFRLFIGLKRKNLI